MKINIKIQKIVKIFFILCILFNIQNVYAATSGFSPSSLSYKVGDEVRVNMTVSSGESINAISAKILFPKDILTLTSVSKASSVISLWVKEPSYSNEEGFVSFDGIMLNGYTGNSGTVVTLFFKAKNTGNGFINFSSASVLANDGNATEVLGAKGTSTVTITKALAMPVAKEVAKAPAVKKVAASKNQVVDMTISITEVKDNLGVYFPNKFLITSAQSIPGDLYSIQIDDMASQSWIDDGTHIFIAPELSNGIHKIKVNRVDSKSNILSGSYNFTTTFLKVPVITYYPDNLYVDQFMVLKGQADPLTNVEITITNKQNGALLIGNVNTNSNGKFTYVPDDKLASGTYTIITRAINNNGINSLYTKPIQVINKEYELNFMIIKISNIVLLLIPILALIAFIIILSLLISYKITKLHHHLDKKLINAKRIVSRSFEILDEDAEEEIAIFRKIRSAKILDKNEQAFLGKFKKDIEEAEIVIEKELKEIENINSK